MSPLSRCATLVPQHENAWPHDASIFEYFGKSDFLPIIQAIQAGSFDINQVDEKNETLLMKCCICTCNDMHQKIIDLLLQRNADVNIVDDIHGSNALMYSMELNRPEVSARLVQLTDLTVMDRDNRHALTLAIYHGRSDMIELICNTARNAQDILGFKAQITAPDHSLSPFAHKYLDKLMFGFELSSQLDKHVSDNADLFNHNNPKQEPGREPRRAIKL